MLQFSLLIQTTRCRTILKPHYLTKIVNHNKFIHPILYMERNYEGVKQGIFSRESF
jgi:hypothetical protein